ncbi:MAG: hypothetical protein L7T81_06040 [Candidatus Poseidoniaceae archaeon]|nr:hypothetical protein [Candidatus Poseidoniaceae archaeon]
MGASVGIGGLIVGTSMMVVFALAVNVIDIRVDSSLDTLDSANEPLPTFTIDVADIALGAVTSLQIDDAGDGYLNGTLSTLEAGGFTGSFTVNSTGSIISWSITDHGDYSSDPTIVIDNPPPGATNGALSVLARTTVVDASFSNTGSVIVPVEEVWLFLDGQEPTKLAVLAPSVPSDNIYSGDTVSIEWRGLGNTVFEKISLSANGYSVTRALV